MARTRRRASSPAQQEPEVEASPEAPEQDDDTNVDRPVRFAEEISWRPGKPITVSVLLRRLESLSGELASFEQGESGHNTFKDIAKSLVNTQLIDHKDAGVRAWTLLCITQVFSIAVPQAPYTLQQLQDIFSIFIKEVLPALADSTSSYRQQYVQILTLLVEDRSIILILDLPDSERMILNLFRKTFDIMAGKDEDDSIDAMPSNIEYKLVKMLSEIIEEADALEPEAIEIILAQFMHFAAHTKPDTSQRNYEYPTSYNVARSICNSSVTRMMKYVSEYFSSVLISATDLADKPVKPQNKKRAHAGTTDDQEEKSSALSDEDLKDAKRAHMLLRELWRSSPDVVQGIIPQIEAELGAESQHMRMMAVEVVGDMIAGIGAIGPPEHVPLDPTGLLQISSNLAKRWTGIYKPTSPHAFSAAYPTCYQAFMDRHRDKSASVRAAWATAIGHVLVTNAGGKGLSAEEHTSLAQHIATMLRDHDERVRLAAVHAVTKLEVPALIDLLQRETDKSGLVRDALFERASDTNQQVRAASIDLLGRTWGAASSLLRRGDVGHLAVLGSVPSLILELRYKNIPDLNELIYMALFNLLLPATYPSSKVPDSQQQTTSSQEDHDTVSAQRILLLVQGLSEKASKVFSMLQQSQPSQALAMAALLDLQEPGKSNQSQAKAAITSHAERLAKWLPKQEPAVAHLRSLSKQDQRVRHLIRFCISADSDLSKVVKATRELRRNFAKQPEDQQVIWETLGPLLRVISVFVNNRSHVPAYTHYARTNEDGLGPAADLLIQGIAAKSPAVLKIHINELYKELQRSQPTAKNPGTTVSTANALKACANFARKFAEDMTNDRTFFQAMVAYALYGSPAAAKHAVSIIVLAAPKKEMLVTSIVTASIKDFEYGGPYFLARLAALSQLRLLANEMSEEYADEITRIATAEVLAKAHATAQDDDPDWSEVDGDDHLTAKLLALKILVNGLRGKQTQGSPGDVHEALQSVARPPYRLLNGLIAGEGDLSKDKSTPKHHRAHLRLAAGKLLLRLARERKFDRFLSAAQFGRLAMLCQDKQQEVRSEFAKSLRKYLGSSRLPSRYLALPFMYAHEPAKDIKNAIETWIRSRVVHEQTEQEAKLADSLPVLLSLLNHSQFFSRDDEGIEEAAQYVTFFLSLVASEQNLAAIYSLAQRLKTVQDGINPDKSDDLYLISDLAEAVIRAFQDEKAWSLQASASVKKPQLPAGFFSSLPSDVDPRELAEHRFLPGDIVDSIPDIVRAQLKQGRKKHDRAIRPSRPKVERKRQPGADRRASKRSATPESEDDSDGPSYKKPKLSKTEGSARRSSRHTAISRSYVEADSDEDDLEMEKWDKHTTNEDNKENLDHDMDGSSETNGDLPDHSSTPPKRLSSSQTTRSTGDKQADAKVGRKSTRTSTRSSNTVA